MFFSPKMSLKIKHIIITEHVNVSFRHMLFCRFCYYGKTKGSFELNLAKQPVAQSN